MTHKSSFFIGVATQIRTTDLKSEDSLFQTTYRGEGGGSRPDATKQLHASNPCSNALAFRLQIGHDDDISP
jgi:hypothetical protein